MAFNREAALAEGYSEDEINAYMQAEAEKKKQPTAPVVDVGEPPAPQTKIETVGTSPEAVATTGAMAIAPYVLPAAAAGAAALGGSKLYGAWNASAEAAKDLARAQMETEAGRANRAAQKIGVAGPAVPTGGAQISAVAPAGGVAANEPMTQKPASMQSRVQAAAANNIKNLPPASTMGNIGKMAGRVLPGAGTVLNAVDAYDRAKQGDYLGAGIAGVGAAASPFPVLGTAVGMGTGAINAYRDYLKRQEEEKKRMGQQ
jgi:hypothetical protein